jgi:oxidoreductase
VTPRIDVALLGAGWIADRAYLPALIGHPALRLIAIHDPVPERAEQLAARCPGTRAVTDVAAALALAEASIVCAPAADHLALLAACRDADHVTLCEKPVLRSAAELGALGAEGLARVMGSATMRMRDDIATLLGWVADGRLGALRRVRLAWWRHAGVPSPGSWRTRAACSPGGVLEDLGPHLLDIAAALVPDRGGRAATVQASELRRRGGARTAGAAAAWFGGEAGGYDAPDYCRARLAVGGCELALELAWTDPDAGDRVVIEVDGEHGRAAFDGLLGFSTDRRRPEQRCVLEAGGRTERRDFPVGPAVQHRAFAASLDRFAAVCRGEARPLSDGAEIAQVARWIDQIRAASLREAA